MAYFRSLEGVGALLCCFVPFRIIPKITSHAFRNLGCSLLGVNVERILAGLQKYAILLEARLNRLL